MRTRIATATSLAVACASVGIVSGLLLALFVFDQPTPQSLAAANQPTSAAATLQAFYDPQEATVTISRGRALVLRSGRPGTITSYECARGQSWESGSSTVSIDGVPLVNLYTSVPLWRPIEVGLEGADVTALKEELGRLGYTTSSGGVFKRIDADSVISLVRRVAPLRSRGS